MTVAPAPISFGGKRSNEFNPLMQIYGNKCLNPSALHALCHHAEPSDSEMLHFDCCPGPLGPFPRCLSSAKCAFTLPSALQNSRRHVSQPALLVLKAIESSRLLKLSLVLAMLLTAAQSSPGRAGQGRAEQGREGRARQGRARAWAGILQQAN